MGVLEESGKRRQRKNVLTHLVLSTVGIAGGLAIALVAPNAIGAMSKLGLVPGRRQKDSINQARDRLIRQGLIKVGGGYLRVTSRGEVALRLLEDRDSRVPGHGRRQPERWDGRWRVLIFDIPETKRATRDKIRRSLMSVGFIRLQDSVWAYPYDCEDFVALLKADFKIGRDVLYLIVEEMEADQSLRQRFGLH